MLSLRENDAVLFSAEWCSVCPPAVKKAEENGIKVYKVTTETLDEVKKEYGLKAVPVLIKFKDGVEIARYTGIPEVMPQLG